MDHNHFLDWCITITYKMIMLWNIGFSIERIFSEVVSAVKIISDIFRSKVGCGARATTSKRVVAMVMAGVRSC